MFSLQKANLEPPRNALWDAVSTMHHLLQFFLSPSVSLERFGGQKGSPRGTQTSERRLESRSKSSKNTIWCHMGSRERRRNTSSLLKSRKNRSNLTVWEPGASLQHLQTCTLLQEHNMALKLQPGLPRRNERSFPNALRQGSASARR